MVDIATTIAVLLDLDLPYAESKPIEQILERWTVLLQATLRVNPLRELVDGIAFFDTIESVDSGRSNGARARCADSAKNE
jgi:hypothetical protein